MGRITSKSVAETSNLSYVRKFKKKRIPYGKVKGNNNFYFDKSKIIHFYPPNDVNGSHSVKWFKLTSEDTIVKIHDNRDSFAFISNISEILLTMTNLYIDYLYNDIAINPYEFCIHFDDEVEDKYYSKSASLVLTKKTIVSGFRDISDLKVFYLNEFLDHFIGWNFGAVISTNPKLENALIELSNLAISEGLRKNASISYNSGRKNHYSKTVRPYSFN